MKKSGFIDGAIIATAAIFISKILGLLYVIPFYRIVGEKGGALYGYAYNIYNIFLIISSAGIPLAISKLTSEYVTKNQTKEKEAMYDIARKMIYIFSFSAFLICFVFAKQISTLIIGNMQGGNSIKDVTTVIRSISFALIIVPVLSISRGYLQGHKYIAVSSLSQVIEQITRIAIILLGSFLALKVFDLPLVIAISIAVFAAAIGALIGYIYLLFNIKKLRKNNNKDYVVTKEEKKSIIIKVITYSLPFVIVNIANSIYNSTDMILIIKGLNRIGYNANDIEIISSVFTTWGDKLGNIVKAIATGLTISLIPSMVSAFVSKKQKEVNSYFNKSLQILLFIIVPLTIFMSIFAKDIWNVFYGDSFYGPLIFKYTILVVSLDSAYVLIGSALQGLYKTKLIYISVFIGVSVNLLMDIPLMLLFNKLNLYPFYGAIVSTVLGYSFSLFIPLIVLKHKDNFDYTETLSKVPLLIMSLIPFIALCLLYRNFVISPTSIIFRIIYLVVIAVIAFGAYYLVNYKFVNELLNLKKEKK